jgi:hypothetical protein
MTADRLVFNGIDGSSGDYLLDPMTPAQVAAVARGEALDEPHLRELEIRRMRQEAHYGVVRDVDDPTDLSQAGWGVIFASGADPQIREALKELLDWRKELAAKTKETYYREFTGPDAYRPGESSRHFLARQKVAVDQPADPGRGVPYYLLIVGDPEAIPFRFQYQLDVQYAVGRIHFDTLEEYACYARSVVAAERGRAPLPRRAVFFGVQNDNDRATNLSAEQMIKPLGEKMAQTYKEQWKVQTRLKEQAMKAHLAALVGGKDMPALLFTVSHGMGFPLGDKRQLPHQGALLCQDWPGPRGWGVQPIPEKYYFAADDLGDDARLLGSMTFHFACYGAGTPRLDDFPNLKLKARPTIAPHAFVARLPQRLLAHPKGGAVAVVGHVERAWGYSFWGDREKQQLQSFESAVQTLLEGEPVGWALEYLNQRYAAVSADLTEALEDNRNGTQNDPELASAWTANNDARSYVVFGDPAARLVVADAGQAAADRPAIEPIVLQSRPAAAPPPVVPPAVVQPPPPGAPAGAGAEFGIVDQLQGARDQVSGALRQLAERFGQALQEAVEQLTTLEVATYVSDNMADVKYEHGQFTGGAKLRALSRIKLLGDLLVCVPEKSGDVDQALWNLHVDMVQRAQAHRAEMLKTLGAAATGLLDALKGL